MRIWVDQLRISEAVAEKIINKHGLTPEQVRSAVVRIEGLEFSWDYDDDRGPRAIVETTIDQNDVWVVLYEADDLGNNIWRLGSAYPVGPDPDPS